MAIIGLTVLLLCIGLSGCEEENHPIYTKEDFIGSWNTTDGGKFIFYENNTFYMESPKGTNIDGTYNVTENILNIFTFLNEQSLQITMINPNRIKLKFIDSPSTNPLILVRPER